MAACKITVRELEAAQRQAKAQDKILYLWDTTLKGFGVRVSPNRTSWLVQKWIGGRGGKAKRIVIGHCPPMELEDARKAAGAVVSQVGRGVDLVSQRQQERQQQRERLHGTKLGEAVSLYIKRNKKPGRYWFELEQLFNNLMLDELGENTPVSDITKQDIRQIIEYREDIGQHGSARNIFVALTADHQEANEA